ncbi:MAG: glycosyltransferase family A protein [Actinomycetes bacterium]
MNPTVERIGAAPRAARPQISAIIPCYNMERFIRLALESVEQQDGHVEIVVINDCSTDASESAIRSWAQNATVPCTLVTHPRNRGLPASLNSGLSEARGTYVSFLDADDRWEPGLAEKHTQMLDSLGPSYAAVYGDAHIESVEGVTLRESFIDHFRPESRPSGDIFEELLYGQNFMNVSAVTVRKQALSSVGAFDESLPFQDYDMWLRLASRFKFAYSESSDAIITAVPGSMSDTMGVNLFRSYLIIWAKWRDDPRVDRRRLRGQAANAIFGLAGGRAFTGSSAIPAVSEGLRLYRDPMLAAAAANLLGRVAVSRARRRIQRTADSSG